METQQRRQLKRYLDMAWRRKGLLLAGLLLGLTVGLGVYLTQPKLYQSVSLLSYQQQKVNPAKMSPDIQAQIRDIVSTLSQLVTSRTSLERIITEVNLYQEARRNLPMEDIVERMRANIEITPSRQGDTFHISFIGSDPRQVARVTNTLASMFIEENLKYREERAEETSAYTANELEMAKTMLDRKEAVMRDYKLKYYNEMPEQRDANMARLISLQEQYQKKQESIQDLERTRVLVQDQIVARRQLLEENEKLKQALEQEAIADQPAEENDLDKLVRLRQELLILKERYTEQHPAIRRLEKMIAHLEQILPAGEAAKPASELPKQEPAATGEGQSFDQVIASYEIQLKDIALSIEELNQEREKLKAEIEQYEEWMAAAPVREAEWSALTREYGELKRHYDYLVSQNLQARSALNLERNQKGSQFKIEDPARVPEKPVKPDFFRIIGLALLGGLGAGGALALGLELLNTSYRDPDYLEEQLKLEVICSVPYLPLPGEVRKRRLLTALGILIFLAYAAALGGAFFYFWQQGKILF